MEVWLLAKQRAEEAAYAEQHAVALDLKEHVRYLVREVRRHLDTERGAGTKEGVGVKGEGGERREELQAVAQAVVLMGPNSKRED